MRSKVNTIKYVPTVSMTGEKVNLIRVECTCGHVLSFLSQHPVICRHCGKLVYPSKKCEFKDKMMRKLKI